MILLAWEYSPNRDEHLKKYLKPPTRYKIWECSPSQPRLSGCLGGLPFLSSKAPPFWRVASSICLARALAFSSKKRPNKTINKAYSSRESSNNNNKNKNKNRNKKNRNQKRKDHKNKYNINHQPQQVFTRPTHFKLGLALGLPHVQFTTPSALFPQLILLSLKRYIKFPKLNRTPCDTGRNNGSAI